jgi:hypothetical protein
MGLILSIGKRPDDTCSEALSPYDLTRGILKHDSTTATHNQRQAVGQTVVTRFAFCVI